MTEVLILTSGGFSTLWAMLLPEPFAEWCCTVSQGWTGGQPLGVLTDPHLNQPHVPSYKWRKSCVEKPVEFLSGHQAALEPRSARAPPPLCACLGFASSHPPPQHPLPPPIPSCPAAEQHLQQNKPALCTDPAAPAPLSLDQPLRDRPDFRSCPRRWLSPHHLSHNKNSWGKIN